MALKKKQGEFKFYGRVIANDIEGNLEASNISVYVDQVCIDGIDLVEADLTLDDVAAAIKALYVAKKGL